MSRRMMRGSIVTLICIFVAVSMLFTACSSGTTVPAAGAGVVSGLKAPSDAGASGTGVSGTNVSAGATGTGTDASDGAVAPQDPSANVETEEYSGKVYHLFTHFLIAFPEIAYANGKVSPMDTDCITPTEFGRLLDQLYANDYVLVDINYIYETATVDGKTVYQMKKKITVPKGKKPLVISIDDMNYDPRKSTWGMIGKLIVDKDGNIAASTPQKDGTELITYDNEVVTMLEAFIKKHPDFSYKKGRMTLALTGFVGILGYRTQIDEKNPNRESEIEAVKPVVAKLKELGYSFASHGYGHRHSSKVTYETMVRDTNRWRDEVETLVGDTKIYVWPYGEEVKTDDPKYRYMVENGFRVFCPIDKNSLWTTRGDTMISTRQCVDGYTLRNYKDVYLKAGLFDCEKIISLSERLMASYPASTVKQPSPYAGKKTNTGSSTSNKTSNGGKSGGSTSTGTRAGG